MIQLLRPLDFARYTPRTYILSRGDHLSTSKATELELSKSAVSSCCQHMCTHLIIAAGGPTAGYEDNNSLPCSRNPSNTLYHSTYHIKVSRAFPDRDFSSAGASGRTDGRFIAPERTRDMCDGSRSCLLQSGTILFLCMAHVGESSAELTRSTTVPWVAYSAVNLY